MISIPIKDVKAIISHFKTEIKTFSDSLITDLEDYKSNALVTERWQKRYINEIIRQGDKIITYSPEKLSIEKLTFEDIIDIDTMKSDEMKPFRDKLIKIMGYSARRSDFYPGYFNKVGIKACVYCNSALTVAVLSEDENGEEIYKAKFQVDHYYAKSKYPCFSVSLFNLYPVCGSCNLSKGVKNVLFKLYQKNITTSAFEFKLDQVSKALYITSKKIDDLKFEFKEPPIPARQDSHTFTNTFDIQGIYDTQKDLLEELVQKKLKYGDVYKHSLLTSFPDLFNRKDLAARIIIGNYCDEKDTHKRPMAKFTRDMAIQLDLIKK